MMIQGIGVSEGIGRGQAVCLVEPEFDLSCHTVASAAAEQERLAAAVAQLRAALEQRIAASAGEQAEILASHRELLADPALLPQIERLIGEQRCNSEYAAATVFGQFIELFQSSGDELLALRATDLKDLRQNLLKLLNGVPLVDLHRIPAGTVLVTEELSTSVAAGIRPEKIAGIVTRIGGKTAHMAIIARSLGIPAVVQVAPEQFQPGQEVIVDGTHGTVIIDPDAAQQADCRRRQEQLQARRAELEQYRGVPSRSRDGVTVTLCANAGLALDIDAAKAGDAEGIGLFRTEFLYMDRSAPPGEAEQFAVYKRAAETFGDQPVIIRTLDVGGDKEIAYLGIEPEENPFLGYRAIRYCLEHEELFRTQLRAILRASAFGNVQIMIPMVAAVEEFTRARALITAVQAELEQEGTAFDPRLAVGLMMETPAAAVMADTLARQADFFSIGTNDLTQYVLAADRGNKRVAGLYNTAHPAVLRLLYQIGQAAGQAGIPCGLCGEAGADPQLIAFLLGCGIDELSMTAGKILAAREIVRKTDIGRARAYIEAHLAAVATTAEAGEFLEKLARE